MVMISLIVAPEKVQQAWSPICDSLLDVCKEEDELAMVCTMYATISDVLFD